MAECIFCGRGIRSNGVIYEDEHCFAILDKYPVSEAHVLVIPKVHFENMLDAPDAVIASVYRTARLVAIHIRKVMGADGVNVTTNIGKDAGQYIMHFHVHVIPRYRDNRSPDDSYRFDHNTELSPVLRDKLIQRLKMG